MPLTIADLIANPQRIQELQPVGDKCEQCGRTLEETVTGRHETQAGVFCSDHYYDQLGEIVEAHPITSGRTRSR
ncbi:MAG: hypothetical protein ACR2OZ_20535 [Verrucomicrobiales bacterium]